MRRNRKVKTKQRIASKKKHGRGDNYIKSCTIADSSKCRRLGDVPEWKGICLTNHAIERFMERARCGCDVKRTTAIWMLKQTVILGRRSDQDFSLVNDLLKYTKSITWTHKKRQVVLFYCEGVGALVVPDVFDDRRFVVLTCFITEDFIDLQSANDRMKVLAESRKEDDD